MSEIGKIGKPAVGATGTPAKSGKVAGKQKTKETEQLGTLIKNYYTAMKESKVLDKLDGKEDGIIDMGKITEALTGKTAKSLKPITVDDYIQGQLFPPKTHPKKK